MLRKRLECVMALLCRGAEINIGDGDGNTPLHLAIISLNIPIVQALIVFGADLHYKLVGYSLLFTIGATKTELHLLSVTVLLQKF